MAFKSEANVLPAGMYGPLHGEAENIRLQTAFLHVFLCSGEAQNCKRHRAINCN